MSGKTDLERIGLFKEMSYPHGKPYVAFIPCPFNEDAHHGKQLETVGFKSRDGTSAGYFSTLLRPFEGEGFMDKMKVYRKERMSASARQISPKFYQYISFPGKMRYGLGSHLGTFSGVVPAFSPAVHDKVKRAPLMNFIINPPKKGSGYQYPNVGINSFPTYSSSDYEAPQKIFRKEQKIRTDEAPFVPVKAPGYFDKNPWLTEPPLPVSKTHLIPVVHVKDTFQPPRQKFKPLNPGKKPGGMKAGCFTAYSDLAGEVRGRAKRARRRKPLLSGPFHAYGEKKAAAFVSVLQHNVNRKVNRNNYHSIQEVMYNKSLFKTC